MAATIAAVTVSSYWRHTTKNKQHQASGKIRQRRIVWNAALKQRSLHRLKCLSSVGHHQCDIVPQLPPYATALSCLALSSAATATTNTSIFDAPSLLRFPVKKERIHSTWNTAALLLLLLLLVWTLQETVFFRLCRYGTRYNAFVPHPHHRSSFIMVKKLMVFVLCRFCVIWILKV